MPWRVLQSTQPHAAYVWHCTDLRCVVYFKDICKKRMAREVLFKERIRLVKALVKQMATLQLRETMLGSSSPKK